MLITSPHARALFYCSNLCSIARAVTVVAQSFVFVTWVSLHFHSLDLLLLLLTNSCIVGLSNLTDNVQESYRQGHICCLEFLRAHRALAVDYFRSHHLMTIQVMCCSYPQSCDFTLVLIFWAVFSWMSPCVVLVFHSFQWLYGTCKQLLFCPLSV